MLNYFFQQFYENNKIIEAIFIIVCIIRLRQGRSIKLRLVYWLKEYKAIDIQQIKDLSALSNVGLRVDP